MDSFVKVVVFVPTTHADLIRAALAEAGAGKMGNYDSCSFSVKGMGRFRPLDGAQPFVGNQGSLEQVEEERIETICLKEKYKNVVEAIRKVHPYEEPAIDTIPLLND